MENFWGTILFMLFICLSIDAYNFSKERLLAPFTLHRYLFTYAFEFEDRTMKGRGHSFVYIPLKKGLEQGIQDGVEYLKKKNGLDGVTLTSAIFIDKKYIFKRLKDSNV